MEMTVDRRCGARELQLPDGAILWRVWAPRAGKVELVLIDGERRRHVGMAAEERGYFTHSEANVPEGQRYAFRLDGGDERPDPVSLWQPDGPHGPSAVVRLKRFPWTDGAWKGVKREDLVIYELHVGTFTPDGTFEAIIPRLASLRDLGVTAIELMPVAQFPGKRGWGYDGVNLFAPQNSYGGPQGLQKLVDACHAAGLALFLDVVYNHLGPEGNYLNDFGPYFAHRYRTFWGPSPNFDSAGCDAVRDYVLDNVRLWIEAYHMDGLRLDAIHAIYDMGPKHILREIKEAADVAGAPLGWPIHIIAESNLNDIRIIETPERGGYGLDGQWSDDFHHVVHTHLTGELGGYYADYGKVRDFAKVFETPFVYDGAFSPYRDRRHGASAGNFAGDCFVIAIQNHDQVGNRMLGERLGALVAPPAQRLAASLMLLAPYVPLLFMGEEYGEQNPFLFFCSFEDRQLIENVRAGRREEFASFAWKGEVPDPQAESTFHASRLGWSWLHDGHRAGLRRLYRDLLHARRAWPALKNLQDRSARLVPDDQPAVLQVLRGGKTPRPGTTVRIDFNLTDRPQALEPKPAGEEIVLFTSEAARYGGRKDTEPPRQLMPFECIIFGPAAWKKVV